MKRAQKQVLRNFKLEENLVKETDRKGPNKQIGAPVSDRGKPGEDITSL